MNEESDQQADLVRISGKNRSEFPEPTPVAASLPKPDVAAGEAWTRPRIQAEIRRIVGEQVGARSNSLKARFVDDIGIS
jgi:hypothetical protein